MSESETGGLGGVTSTVHMDGESSLSLWLWFMGIGGVLPTMALWALGNEMSKAILVLGIPLSVLPLMIPFEMARARKTTVTVYANGRASFVQTYMIGQLKWYGLARDITDVKFRPADAENETGAMMAFTLGGRDDIEVECSSDKDAMDAAQRLNKALGIDAEPRTVTDARGAPTRSSVKIALSKAVHIIQTPD